MYRLIACSTGRSATKSRLPCVRNDEEIRSRFHIAWPKGETDTVKSV